MIETLTLITLSIILLIVFRPGKVTPLENPLTINRIGQFSAVLAPMLNLAQPFLETVSRKLSEADRHPGDTAPLYFSVQDREVRAHGEDHYLLAATLRGGVLYFQATAPQAGQSDVEALRAFSEAELARHPAAGEASNAAHAALVAAVQAAAGERGVAVVALE
ncbi:MAG: hypothetical protein LBE50_05145 [Gallionellaceae bacterium]|nr:hypothetical protein [Gallionellaceae bacterium]